MAMQINSALQKHERAISISSDGERSSFDALRGREKLLVAQYRTSTWCIHIKNAFYSKKLPNVFVVRFANLFCNDCFHELSNSNEETVNKMRKKLGAVQSTMLRQLVEMYCAANIDIKKNSIYTTTR